MSRFNLTLNSVGGGGGFWGLPLFRAMAVCHLRWHCQVPRARACDWISKSSLEALFSYSSMQTHSLIQIPKWLMLSVFMQVFVSCFWKRVNTRLLPAYSHSAHIHHHLSFPSSLFASLPPLSFVTRQRTYFSPIFGILFHKLHHPRLHIFFSPSCSQQWHIYVP